MKGIAFVPHPDAVLLTAGFMLLMLTVLVGRLAALLEAMTRLLLAWMTFRKALSAVRHRAVRDEPPMAEASKRDRPPSGVRQGVT
jgi:hypothetical protein